MNPYVKKIWLDALRSGTYTKGEGRLYYRTEPGNECFCALGVLAEEAAKAGVIQVEPAATGNDRYPAPGNQSYLSVEVLAWAGLDTPVDPGDEYNNWDQIRVARENDSHAGTFEEVAEFIEAKF